MIQIGLQHEFRISAHVIVSPNGHHKCASPVCSSEHCRLPHTWFFHDRLIPPFASEQLSPAMGDLLDFAEKDFEASKDSKGNCKAAPKRAQCTLHSVPKRKLARRFLCLPNPRNQALLVREVVANWQELVAHCEMSQISMTTPVFSLKRAVQGRFSRSEEGVSRATRSVGFRYVLHADLARFYPSIYGSQCGEKVRFAD